MTFLASRLVATSDVSVQVCYVLVQESRFDFQSCNNTNRFCCLLVPQDEVIDDVSHCLNKYVKYLLVGES